MAPNKQKILAVATGWMAVTLNVVPGLATGYLYERRWKVYWITSAWLHLVSTRGGPGAKRRDGGRDAEPVSWTRRPSDIGNRKAVEAGLSTKRARRED